MNIHEVPAALADQPHARVDRDGVRYTLLGTAHVSKESVAAVEAALASEAFDVIAVELDPARHRALTDPNALAKLDLVQAIKSGKAGLLAANLALAAYQRRLSEQLGVEPGAELKAAAVGATAHGLPMVLIDRDIGLTFKRAWSRLGWWKRSMRRRRSSSSTSRLPGTTAPSDRRMMSVGSSMPRFGSMSSRE